MLFCYTCVCGLCPVTKHFLIIRLRFTKGLKEEDINLSTFKGEGELTSLELDENALMDVLDVPYWVRITSAKCDRVFFQVPFMAIKKVPMSLVIHS